MRRALPPLEAGERVELESIRPEQHFTQPPPRYTEASLVKSLESHGIGRPSTYASIIETLRYRRYVEMSGRAFVPTDIGKIVSKFLVKYLGTYVEYGFTAQMEDVLDEISNGEKEWHVELGTFWKPFIKAVEHITKSVTREEVAESREIGTRPGRAASRSPCAWASTDRSCSRARATTPTSRASRACCRASAWTTSRWPTR